MSYLKHLGNMRSLFYAEPPCGSRRAEEGSQSAMHIIQDSVMIISPSTFMGDLLCLVLLSERKSFMTEWNDCGRGKREEGGGGESTGEIRIHHGFAGKSRNSPTLQRLFQARRRIFRIRGEYHAKSHRGTSQKRKKRRFSPFHEIFVPPPSRAARQIFGAEPCLLETRHWKRGTHRNFTPKNCTSPRYLLNYKSHVAPLYFPPKRSS